MSSEFPTNRVVQPQKIGRGLKFQIKEEEGLHYLRNENKAGPPLCFRPCKKQILL